MKNYNKNVSLIAVVAKKRAIGKNDALLVYVPGDLPRLKRLTLNHTIIVGRKTLETFPGGNPLPNRTFIVLTKNKDYKNDKVIVAHSVEEALSLCPDNEEIFCMGGGEIYKLFLPLANKMYLTEVYKEFDADTFFPKFNLNDWCVRGIENHTSKEKCDFRFAFINYERIAKAE